MSSQQQGRQPFPHPRVRPDWLAKLTEEVLDPAQPIIDPHHHLWRSRPDRYLLEDLAADIRTGHNVVATVFIQCGSEYRRTARRTAPRRRNRIRGVRESETGGLSAPAPASSASPTAPSASASTPCCKPISRPAPAASKASATAPPTMPASPRRCLPGRPPACTKTPPFVRLRPPPALRPNLRGMAVPPATGRSARTY